MVGGTLFLRLPDPYPKVLFTSVVLTFVAHLPHRLLIGGILLLVMVETSSTIAFILIGSPAPVWLTGAATVLVTAIWLLIMLKCRAVSAIGL